jgi:uncharacterized Zn-binding protein involved in type VI secretion
MNHSSRTKYYLATIGSKTERGGVVVTASTGLELIARVGDTVRYPDGSETQIISGAGCLLVVDGKPAAIVGSELANGDHIISSLQTSCPLVCAGRIAAGVLDPEYCPCGPA